MSLPKIIHQTWKDNNLATHSNIAVSSCQQVQKYHKDWEYKLWTDADIDHFIENVVKNDMYVFYDIYKRLPLKIMRIDFVRYLWMYYFGGIYLDLDVLCFADLNNVFTPSKSAYFIKRAWFTPGYVGTCSVHQAWLASDKFHPIWLDIMTYIGDHINLYSDDVLNLTGPNGISRAFDELNLLYKYKDVFIIDDKHLYQKGWSKTDKKHAIMEHIPAASWKPKEKAQFFIKRIFKKVRSIGIFLKF